MAFTFIKFPKKFLDSEEWLKPRKYSKAEALIHLLSMQEIPPIRKLAKQWQWSKSTVADFIANAKNLGYFGQISDKSRTHLIRDKDIPPILSSTKVESNIIPPRGEREVNPDYLKFLEWLKVNAPRVLQMKEPITEEQFISLKTDFDTQFLCDLLREMHNYEPLLKKNRSANLTLRNWAKRRKQWDNENTKSTTNQASDTESRIANVLKAAARGYARAHTPQEWQN